MKPSSWKRYISFDFQTMLLLRIEHSSSFTAKTDKLSRIPNQLAPGSMIESRAACKALPLLGVLICPWVSSPCVTSVPEEIIPPEYIESLTIVVESLFTLCGKSFFTKRGESLFTQCGGSRHNFELWCHSSLELFDLWRKWDENNRNNITQDCMLLSRNAKNHAMKNHPELWIIIIADHAIESWTGINSNTWMGRHQGSAEVGCLQWWIPWGCSRWSRSPWCPPTTPPRSSTPPSTLSAPHSAPRNDPSPPGSSSTSQSWQRLR